MCTAGDLSLDEISQHCPDSDHGERDGRVPYHLPEVWMKKAAIALYVGGTFA
jgi:hypothetical protein